MKHIVPDRKTNGGSSARIRVAICLSVLVLSACASRLEPISLPPEAALPPSHAELWRNIEATRDDDWHYLMNDGISALDWRLRAIDSATQSIDLQSFLWNMDTVGTAVLSHLLAAADRGVRIRILMDDSFLLSVDNVLLGLQSHPNIAYRIFNPFKRRSNRFVTREILNLGEFHRLDHRMHNKTMTIDNRIAIIGGRNIADEYFGFSREANFRDMELITGGSIVQEISDGFDLYWNNHWSFPVDLIISSRSPENALETLRDLNAEIGGVHQEETTEYRAAQWLRIVREASAGLPVLLLDSPPAKNAAAAENAPVQLAHDIVRLIDTSETEIVIVSAYLIPTVEFEMAVERAETRGVEVRILTNSIRSNNHITAHSAYRHHIRELLSHGADLHEVRTDAKDRDIYMRAPVENKQLALHAKIMVVDRQSVFLGSANFDARSARINTEDGLLIHSEALSQQVLDALSSDFLPRNAWQLSLSDRGHVRWMSDEESLDHQPAQSFMQRIEDWFFSRLPIEGEM